MALLDVIGFGKQSVAAGVEIDSSSGSPTIDTTNFYSAGCATAMRSNGTTVSMFITRQFIANNADKFFQFRMRIVSASTAAASAIALFRDATNGNNISIRLNSTLTLELWDEQAGAQRGADSSALSANTWYLIGLRYNRAAGTCALYINDMTSSVASGVCSATLLSDTIRIGSIDAFTHDITFADIIVTDSSGASMTGFAGDVKLQYFTPTGAGEVNSFATQTGGVAGAANNFTRVNEVTPDDATSFNGSSTLNEEDLFDVTDSQSDVGVVSAVVVGGRFKNSTADATGAFRFEIEKTNGGTKTQSGAIIANSTTFRTNVPAATLPKSYPIIIYVDPDAAAWTKTTLDSMRIGYKKTVSPGTAGRRDDITNIWGYAIYAVAAAAPSNAFISRLAMTGVGN